MEQLEDRTLMSAAPPEPVILENNFGHNTASEVFFVLSNHESKRIHMENEGVVMGVRDSLVTEKEYKPTAEMPLEVSLTVNFTEPDSLYVFTRSEGSTAVGGYRSNNEIRVELDMVSKLLRIFEVQKGGMRVIGELSNVDLPLRQDLTLKVKDDGTAIGVSIGQYAVSGESTVQNAVNRAGYSNWCRQFATDNFMVAHGTADVAGDPPEDPPPGEDPVDPIDLIASETVRRQLELKQLAYDLDQQYGFRINGKLYFNEHKMSEKEFWSDTLSDWVIILPNGNIHRPGGGYPFLVASDPSLYEDISLLLNAQPLTAQERGLLTDLDAATSPVLQSLNLVATPVQSTSETLLTESFEGGWDTSKFLNQESTWANGNTAAQGDMLLLGNRDRFRTVETFTGTETDLVDFSGTFSFVDAEQLFINVYTGSTLGYEGHRPRNELQFAVNMLDTGHPVLTAHSIQDGAYTELAQAEIRLEQNVQYQFHVVCDAQTATLTILDEAGTRIRQMSVPIPGHLSGGGHMGVSNERHPVLGGVRVHDLAVEHTDLQKLGSASVLPYTSLSVLRLMDPEAAVALKFGELQRAYESVGARSLAMQQADVSLLSTEDLTLAVDQLRDTGSFFQVQQQEFEELMNMNMPHTVTGSVALSGMAAEAVEYGQRVSLILTELGGTAQLRAWQGTAASATVTPGQLPDGTESITGTGGALALDLSESDSFVTGVSFTVQTGDASPVQVVFQRGDREAHVLQAASGETVSYEDAAGITGVVILPAGTGTQVTLSALTITGTKNIDQLDVASLNPVSSSALSQAAFPMGNTASFDLVPVAYANGVGFSMGDYWCGRQYIHHSPGAYLRLSMPEELNGRPVNAILGSLYYLDANGIHTLPPEWYEVIDARRIVVGPGAPEHLAIAGGYNPALGVTPGQFYSEVAPAEDMNLTVNIEQVSNGFTDQAGFGGRVQPPSRYKNPVVFGAAHLQANIVNDGQAGGQVIVNVYSGYLEGTANPLQGTYVSEIQANETVGLTANFALNGTPPTDQTHGKVVLEVIYPDGHTQIVQYETALSQSTFGTAQSPDGGDGPGPEVVRTAASQAARIANDLLARAGEASGTERDEKMQQAIAYVNRQENRLEIIASLSPGSRSLFNAILVKQVYEAGTDPRIRNILLAREDGDISNDPRFAWLAQDLHTEVRDGIQVLVYTVEGVEHSFPVAPSIALHDSLKDAAQVMGEGVQSELYAATDAFFGTLAFTGGLSRLSVTGESLRETLALHRDRLAGIPYIGNRFAEEVWNDLDGTQSEVIILSAYDVRTANPEVQSGTNALDRWYATRGEAPIEITWSTSVDQDGTYSLQLQGCDNWDLDRAMVIIDNQHAMPLVSQNSRLNFHLSAGGHTFRVIGLGVPQEAGVSDASFILWNINGFAPFAASKLETMLIADHPEEFDETTPFTVNVDGQVDSLTGVTALINHFAPILHFTGGERFSVPFAVDPNIIPSDGKSDTELDLSLYETGIFDSSNTESAVYASVLENEELGEIAITYNFYFPRSNWEEHGGANTHEGDWEAATVFLKMNGDMKWEPDRIAVGQHIQFAGGQTDKSDGGENRLWNAVELQGGSQPHLYVGLGGHALYFEADETVWPTLSPDVFKTEVHDGSGITYDARGSAFYIPRAAAIGAHSDLSWLLYTGYWGDSNLVDWELGDTAPRGPLFVSSGFPEGMRWLDPWDWSDDFNY